MAIKASLFDDQESPGEFGPLVKNLSCGTPRTFWLIDRSTSPTETKEPSSSLKSDFVVVSCGTLHSFCMFLLLGLGMSNLFHPITGCKKSCVPTNSSEKGTGTTA